MKEFDAIIIGFGKGGKTLATELAQHDWKVAMIERSDKMYGGSLSKNGKRTTGRLSSSKIM